MKYFLDYSKDLSSYKEFDPRAFIGDQNISQELCDFILALALAYNDYKFLNIVLNMHFNSSPEGKYQRSSVWGENMGIKFYIMRLHMSLVYELLKLIENNKKILKDPFLVEIIKSLPRAARESWGILIDAALTNKTAPSKLNRLFMIRNKLFSHYVPSDIGDGYKRGFFKEDGSQTENACISLGNTIKSARFYFADKAVQGYLEKKWQENAETFFASFNKITLNINLALYHVCTKFINKRYPWKEPKK